MYRSKTCRKSKKKRVPNEKYRQFNKNVCKHISARYCLVSAEPKMVYSQQSARCRENFINSISIELDFFIFTSKFKLVWWILCCFFSFLSLLCALFLYFQCVRYLWNTGKTHSYGTTQPSQTFISSIPFRCFFTTIFYSIMWFIGRH